jgi:hypothetical protein
MKSTSMALLLALSLSPMLTALAATDDKPPILKSQPKVGSALPGAVNACGAQWKRIHLTATSVTCEFKPSGRACGSFGAGTPLGDGSGGANCTAPTAEVLGSGAEKKPRCGSGWRLQAGSSVSNGPRTSWHCEPDPGGITCPSGWAGPNVNTIAWDKSGPFSMICQVAPR